MRFLLLLTVAALSHVTQGLTDISGCSFNMGNGKTYVGIYITTGSEITRVCFDKEYNPTSAPDVCIEITGLPLDSSAVTVTSTAPCDVTIAFSMTATPKLNLVLKDGSVTATSLADEDVEMKLYIITESYTIQSTLKKDVPVTRKPSGCMDNSLRFAPGGRFCDQSSLMVCTSNDELVKSADCLTCVAGRCSVGTVCTVTGSSIIDFSFETLSIEDRCGYKLLEAGDVKVEAAFSERRRTDISFLEYLLITIGSKKIQMRPGLVKLDDSVVNLDDEMPEDMPAGVTVSKTATGLSLVNKGKFTVAMDGFSAVIAVENIQFNKLAGLCKNGPVSAGKSTELSPQGCDTEEIQDKDETIDCEAAKTHCDHLDNDIFSSCKAAVASEQFVSACKETLCKYPSVDGIACSFIQAYVTACENAGSSVSGWKDLTGCDSSQCADKYCSENEFCGVQTDGEERCFCRPLFAAKYPKSLGDTTVCDKSSASLTLYTCLLAEKAVHYNELQLLDDTCKGKMDEEDHTLHFAFDSTNICGTVITTDNSLVKFENKVVLPDHSNAMVTRHDQFEVVFSCAYSQPEVQTVALKIKDSSVKQEVTSGDWSFTLNLKVYLDSARTSAVKDDTELQLDQKVWVELSAAELDENLVSIVTKSCWATSEDDKDAKVQYNLVVDGCASATDSSVKVNGNGVGTSNFFSFNMFQFTGASADVYLHCEVTLCVENDCTPECSGDRKRRRRRRGLFQDPSPAFISMSWAK